MTNDVKLRRYLDDLLAQADRMDRLVAKGRQAYDTDEFPHYAAEALLVRLGEVVARIDQGFPGFAEQHPELELRALKSTRNIIAHGYDIVDYTLVWEIASVDVPRVAVATRRLLNVLAADDHVRHSDEASHNHPRASGS